MKARNLFFILLCFLLSFSLPGQASGPDSEGEGPILIPPTLPYDGLRKSVNLNPGFIGLYFAEGCNEVKIEIYDEAGQLYSQKDVKVADNSCIMLGLNEFNSIYTINVYWCGKAKQFIVELN